MKRFLGIEYSCDDTSVGVVTENGDVIYMKTISSFHANGVIPEVAAQSHINEFNNIVSEIDFSQIDGIAATFGPGLVASLMSGINFAKGLSICYNIPLYEVNHLAAHLLAVSLTHKVTYPYLALLVSGGHTQIVVVHDVDQFEVLGGTIDDALGEVFDKVARSMNLGYPGGPILEKLSLQGNAKRYRFSPPLYSDGSCNLSFSGLKTQVIRAIKDDNHADIAASFTYTVCKVLKRKIENAIAVANKYNICDFVVGGGVAANQEIRNLLQSICIANNLNFCPVDKRYCTDNGAMIAWAGLLTQKKATLDSACKSSWFL